MLILIREAIEWIFLIFECDNCGACCRQLIVEVTYLDALREPRLRDLAPQAIDAEKFRYGEHCIHPWRDGACVFLEAQGEDKFFCGIYPTRPNECVAVEPGDAKCQQARVAEGLLLLDDRDGNPIDAALLIASCDEYGFEFDAFDEARRC